mgnify:CR=1 FL=1
MLGNESFGIKTILVHVHLYYYEQLDYFIEKLKNISHCKNSNYNYFLAGTMFLMRANILEKLAGSDLNERDFDLASATGSIGTCAHAIERIFSILTDDCGYKVYGIEDKSLKKYTNPEGMSFWERIFSIRKSSDKRHKIITILGLKIKIRR